MYQVGYHHGLRTMYEYGFINLNDIAPAYYFGFVSAAIGIIIRVCIYAWFMARDQHIKYYYASRDE